MRPPPPPLTPLVASLPPSVPFVAPEAIERRTGHALRLRLGANESPFGCSPRARDAMRATVDEIAWYGDPESFDLRARLATLHGCALEHLTIASGIDDLLGLVVRIFVSPGDRVVTTLGSYPTFEFHVHGFGGALERVPYRPLPTPAPDLDALAAAAHRTGARLVYLANPDNPSGAWLPARDVQALLDALPADCALLLDEAYVEFAPPAEVLPLAMTPSGPADPRLVRTRTFSKVHGMAGARIGYAIASTDVTSAFEKVRHHFGVNRVAQAGALAALDDTDFVRAVIAEVDAGRRSYTLLGDEIGLVALPSATNFVAFDTGSRERARALIDRLRAVGVFARTPTQPPLDRCIRLTIGNPRERTELAAVLRRMRDDGALSC